VDTHVHLAQVFARARIRGNLLEWLNEAIYPEEIMFADLDHVRKAAGCFVRECIDVGVTTANVFLSSHKEASELCFEAVAESGMRAIMGMVHMDQDAPDALLVPAGRAISETEDLASRWHQHDRGRIQYALMPRFALSCSRDLMTQLGTMKRETPSLYVHTHLSETIKECRAVLEAYPEHSDYLAVYESFGLLSDRTVMAHAIHLSAQELLRISAAGAGVAHCPSANLFLKSGVFPWSGHTTAGIRFGLGSDVGAGYQINPFQVMRDAYNVQDKLFLRPTDLFWRATLGGAQALRLDSTIGSLDEGKDADFVVLAPPCDLPSGGPSENEDLEDALAHLIFTGDDRWVVASYVRGRSLTSETV
jgi:guanine deaminase